MFTGHDLDRGMRRCRIGSRSGRGGCIGGGLLSGGSIGGGCFNRSESNFNGDDGGGIGAVVDAHHGGLGEKKRVKGREER